MEEQQNIEAEETLMRLNKYLAHCGISTRKEAVDLIKKGKVSVNETVVKEPFYVVQPTDVIRYNDTIVVPKKSYVYILFNKGSKSPVYHVEGSQSPSVTDLANKLTGRKLSAAVSLDDQHCGLMVLSDDPQFIAKMQEKRHQILCNYEVYCQGGLPENLESLLKTNESIKISALEIIQTEEATKLSLDVKGSNVHELIRVLNAAGCTIEKLDRITIGSLTKKDLKRGWSRALTEKEFIFLAYFG
jgi:23S rRNA pseudouridine2605 synthase